MSTSDRPVFSEGGSYRRAFFVSESIVVIRSARRVCRKLEGGEAHVEECTSRRTRGACLVRYSTRTTRTGRERVEVRGQRERIASYGLRACKQRGLAATAVALGREDEDGTTRSRRVASKKRVGIRSSFWSKRSSRLPLKRLSTSQRLDFRPRHVHCRASMTGLALRAGTRGSKWARHVTKPETVSGWICSARTELGREPL